MGATHAGSQWTLCVEGRGSTWRQATPSGPSVEGSRGAQTVLGGRVSYVLSPEWQLPTRRLQSGSSTGTGSELTYTSALDATSDYIPLLAESETAVGAALTSPGGWGLSTEFVVSDEFSAFGRVNAAIPRGGGRELYVSFAQSTGVRPTAALPTATAAPSFISDDSRPARSIVAGGRERFDDGTELFAEQQLRSGIASDHGAGHRGLVGGSFVRDRVVIRGQSDARHESTAEGRILSIGTTGRAELRLNDALTMAVGGRGANAYTRAQVQQGWQSDRSAWEGSVGAALRPVGDDRVNLFARYASVHERFREGTLSEDWLYQRSHVVAWSGAVEVNVAGAPPFVVSPKAAVRQTTVHHGESSIVDRSFLFALRSDTHVKRILGCGGRGPPVLWRAGHQRPQVRCFGRNQYACDGVAASRGGLQFLIHCRGWGPLR